MNDNSFGTRLTNTHRIITIKSPLISTGELTNSADTITKIDNPEPTIYVPNPIINPVYSQSDSSTIIGTAITTGAGTTKMTTIDLSSSASSSIFDNIDSTTLMMYVAGGALVLYLVLS